MKKISVLLALVALLFTDLAMAAGAVVTSLAGTAQVQTGAAAPRALRVGDEVAQGDTISTGGGSSVVMKFDDGQIAALTSNSRMQISAYSYDPPAQRGNVLLSLVVGGMRALTGLIGHNQPDNVKFRAATATIGIRGSEGSMVTDGTNVGLSVITGAFTFTVGNQQRLVLANQALLFRDNQILQGTIEQIFREMSATFQQLFSNLGQFGGLMFDALHFSSFGQGLTNTPGTSLPSGGTGGGASSR